MSSELPPDASASSPESLLRAEFLGRLDKRLEAGAAEYGNESFDRPGTAEEILEELEDVAGWAYVAWVQMRRRLLGLELAAREIESQRERDANPLITVDAPIPEPIFHTEHGEHCGCPPTVSEDVAELRRKHAGGMKSPLAGD